MHPNFVKIPKNSKKILTRAYWSKSFSSLFEIKFSIFLQCGGVEDEGIAIGEPNATLNTDASKFRHLRDKLQQWNSDLMKRRNSQVKYH